MGERARDWWAAILEFLGVSREDLYLLQSDFRRQIIKPHNRTISNYDMVHQALKQHRDGKFAALL